MPNFKAPKIIEPSEPPKMVNPLLVGEPISLGKLELPPFVGETKIPSFLSQNNPIQMEPTTPQKNVGARYFDATASDSQNFLSPNVSKVSSPAAWAIALTSAALGPLFFLNPQILSWLAEHLNALGPFFSLAFLPLLGMVSGGGKPKFPRPPVQMNEKMIANLASRLHEVARAERRRPNGLTEPWVIETKDPDWISSHGGKRKVNAALLPFKGLPSDVRFKIRSVAEAALEEIWTWIDQDSGALNHAFLERAAKVIYKKGHEQSGLWVLPEGNPPFEKLSETEKRRFLEMARATRDIFGPYHEFLLFTRPLQEKPSFSPLGIPVFTDYYDFEKVSHRNLEGSPFPALSFKGYDWGFETNVHHISSRREYVHEGGLVDFDVETLRRGDDGFYRMMFVTQGPYLKDAEAINEENGEFLNEFRIFTTDETLAEQIHLQFCDEFYRTDSIEAAFDWLVRLSPWDSKLFEQKERADPFGWAKRVFAPIRRYSDGKEFEAAYEELKEFSGPPQTIVFDGNLSPTAPHHEIVTRGEMEQDGETKRIWVETMRREPVSEGDYYEIQIFTENPFHEHSADWIDGGYSTKVIIRSPDGGLAELVHQSFVEKWKSGGGFPEVALDWLLGESPWEKSLFEVKVPVPIEEQLMFGEEEEGEFLNLFTPPKGEKN